jgi:2-dehydropantoate 2-reductase
VDTVTGRGAHGLRVAVLGPGGVGGLLGALLARAGADVVCLAGARTAAVLAERGLHVSSGRYGALDVPVRAAERLTEPVDVCLVTVKATHLQGALERVPGDVLGSALVVPLLNGVDHLALLRSRYPAAGVVAATIRVESTRIEPGVVRHGSPFAGVALAAVGERADDVRRLAAALGSAGLDVTVTGDEGTTMWGKLVFLAPLALLMTGESAPAGVVRQRRRDDLTAVIAEAAAVARAEGAAVDEAEVLRAFDALPEGMQSSMQRDAAAGRPLEVDAIGDAVVRAADRSGIAVPVTSGLVKQLRERHG